MLDALQLQATRDDRTLFAGLSFRLSPGQVMQVAGPNGSGKTTLLNGIAGLFPLDSGELHWQGRKVTDDPLAFRRAFSWLGHQAGLKLMLTPLENLAWLSQLRGNVADKKVMQSALEKVGLYGYEEVPLAHLSAGQKRRVGLARLFVEKSPVWILDEPFTAIDRQGVGELEGWLQEHAATGGMVLLTTHHEFAVGFPLQRLDVSAFRPHEELSE
ncbi:MAG: cytochrome c biogenesis heme-transporting ATPase CcmA [Moraxellaceae bacterium]|nr:cytochrome c biogenesis heme-transporting ATPase CcmA [Moraxellaceae bacterium]MBP7230265.1 cytochrome c biogenesis heme-transporting ATPase CcmA [Moraxellaceae bacterium]MCC6199206.1 cytochrome c biogenesis heme-transporting ATPase CcmA [Moraxellaceae bacterium]HQV40405.1 cytochrome c biogenesis heme-transporting ATPase CcmA [Moraxellaceae bacterium]HQX89196.1 cytochrome c biogenesis heme-transporting ATPase CcmA [Moraxellaceae bacterium]